MSATTSAQRFAQLWSRCVASPPSPDGPAVHAQLSALYRGSDRRFHNLRHIAGCIGQVDEIAHLLVDRDAVELALWFHDAVYVPGASDNERRSARLFLDLSTGASERLRRRVCRLILATRHCREVRGNDARFVVDIDLSGFGAPWNEFMRKGDVLREEYAGLSDAQYYAGQVAFIAGLRRRKPAFFATDYYRERYEATAQQNLARLLELRAGQGYAVRTTKRG
jgi:predicted metal-dependent HD superfamily phosphohydrolase